MLPTIFPPASLPKFLAAGHGSTEKPTNAEVKRGRGHGRARSLTSGAPRVVDVSWFLNTAQMAVLDRWFENDLIVGSKHFTAEIANIGPGQVFFDAVWVAPYTAVPQPTPRGVEWTVSGQIISFGVGETTRPEIGDVETEIGFELVSLGYIVGDGSVEVDLVFELESGAQNGAVEIVFELETNPVTAGEVEIGFELTATGALVPAGGVIDSASLDAYFGATVGSLIRRGTTAWEAVAPGTTGEVLTMGATLPDWDTAGGLGPIADARVLANISGAAAVPAATSVSALLDYAFDNDQGGILYRGAAGWAFLMPGTSGQYLKTNGASANPAWAAVAGGGGSGISIGLALALGSVGSFF